MSAHPPMRRTLSIVVLLLAASAVSALAATVESAAHRKASTYSHRSGPSSLHSTVKRSPTHSRARTTSRTAVHTARYTPRNSSAHAYSRSSYSVRNGSRRSSARYRGSYDPGRAAVIRKIAAAETELNSRHSGVSRRTEVASLHQPQAPQTASARTASRAAYDAATVDRQPVVEREPVTDRQPSGAVSQPVSPVAGPSSPEASAPEAAAAADSAHQLSPGEASELPISHGTDASAPQSASEPGTAAANAPDQPESPATARELTHENVDSDTPPPTQVATLDLRSAGMPSTLRGSLASLERQNSMLNSEGLERILDEDDLASRIHHGLLVPVPVSADLAVNPSLIENHRYCRPWTARFLTDLSRAHAAAYHRPLEVNSAVRTVQYQAHLMRVNHNAAAAEGDVVSPHLTGATIDIAKQGMTHKELVWMRRHLLAIQDAGKIDVEEEFRQACFHITVYKSYSSSEPSHKAAQPAVRDAANQHKASPGSSLPASIAAGTLVPHGR